MAGLLGGGFGKALGGLLDDPARLARAAAFFQGDYDIAADISNSMAQRGLLAQKQQAEMSKAQQAQQEFEQRVQILVARGIPENEARALAGDDTAFRQIVGGQYEAEKPDAFTRFEKDILPNPDRLKNFQTYQDLTNPKIVQGADSRFYNMPRGGGLPPGFDPNEWEVVPGGPTGSRSGGFR